jgi:hypothetical protein
MRFELTVHFRTPDPQPGALDHSATSPYIYYTILPLFTPLSYYGCMATYRLYIDESGTHSYSLSQQADKRYLALTGIAIRRDLIEDELQPRIRKLKSLINNDPDFNFTLHREEIIARSGIYSRLEDPLVEEKWNSEMLSIADGLDFVIFTVVIDKIAHKTKYYHPEHPYHYCLGVILEKYVRYLASVDGKGDVIAETRGKSEDIALKEEYEKLYASGTQYVSSAVFQQKLSSKEIKLKKKDSIAGLELADMIVLASKLDVLLVNKHAEVINSKFMRTFIPHLQKKYYRNQSTGKIIGYGKKMI